VVGEVMQEENLDFFTDVVTQLQEEHEGDLARVAAALMFLAQESKPLKPAGADLRSEAPPAATAQAPAQARREAPAPRESWPERKERAPHGDTRDERPVREDRPERAPREPRSERAPREEWAERSPRAERAERFPREDMPERFPREDRAPQRDRKKTVAPLEFRSDTGSAVYRIAVGDLHGATPREIVGAIANEAGIGSRYIGRIDIRDDHSLIELPAELPNATLATLRRTRVRQQQLDISRSEEAGDADRYARSERANRPMQERSPRKPVGDTPRVQRPRKETGSAGKAYVPRNDGNAPLKRKTTAKPPEQSFRSPERGSKPDGPPRKRKERKP